MKFCPACDVKLKASGAALKCPKCGHEEGGEPKPAKAEAPEEPDFSLLAFEGDEAASWMFQTRSADEPTTRFYRCQKCKYTWRDYT